MNGHEEENPYCYFHPKEVIVGICALCLKEKLLTLASKQGRLSPPKDAAHVLSNKANPNKKPSTTFSKVFALSYFLHRFKFRHRRRSEGSDHPETFTSHEDSFISIKFEEDGQASWAHKASSRLPSEPLKPPINDKIDMEGEECRNMGSKSVVEHVKYHAPLRWRKRLGLHLCHLISWKRSIHEAAGRKGKGQVHMPMPAGGQQCR